MRSGVAIQQSELKERLYSETRRPVLSQGRHLWKEERLADEVVLDREAVRVSRLGQQLPGEVGVVLRKLHRDVPEVAGGHRADREPAETAWVHRFLDGLAVDRVHERSPHADVVERRLGHVDVEALL